MPKNENPVLYHYISDKATEKYNYCEKIWWIHQNTGDMAAQTGFWLAAVVLGRDDRY